MVSTMGKLALGNDMLPISGRQHRVVNMIEWGSPLGHQHCVKINGHYLGKLLTVIFEYSICGQHGQN